MLLVDKQQLDKLLEAYKDLPAGVDYQKAMAGYVAATQNYNDMVIKIANLWTAKLQMEKDRIALTAQKNATQVRHAAMGRVSP